MNFAAALFALFLAAQLFALQAAAETPAAPAAAGQARVNWMLHCQGCHRADGAALGEEVPALAGQVARFLHVPGGREFLVQVPGVASAPLDAPALAAVLNWMLREFDAQHLPQNFRPYSAREVRALRRNPLGANTAARRAQLLQAAASR